jgi:hypothetical protein
MAVMADRHLASRLSDRVLLRRSLGLAAAAASFDEPVTCAACQAAMVTVQWRKCDDSANFPDERRTPFCEFVPEYCNLRRRRVDSLVYGDRLWQENPHHRR